MKDISEYIKEAFEANTDVLSDVLLEDGTELSKKFKRWFNGSKIVNKDGTPMVVYHGTNVEFKKFWTTSELGAHFGDIEAARTILTYNGGDIIMPVYIKITNPLRMDDMIAFDPHYVIEYFEKNKTKLPKEYIKQLRSAYDEYLRLSNNDKLDKDQLNELDKDIKQQFQDIIKSSGFDGIVYKNEREGYKDSWIVFDANNIKSIYNDGSWSEKENIYK